jgi:hypothetical protein
VLAQAKRRQLLSSQHFSVDGTSAWKRSPWATFWEAWVSFKRLRPRAEEPRPWWMCW